MVEQHNIYSHAPLSYPVCQYFLGYFLYPYRYNPHHHQLRESSSKNEKQTEILRVKPLRIQPAK